MTEEWFSTQSFKAEVKCPLCIKGVLVLDLYLLEGKDEVDWEGDVVIRNCQCELSEDQMDLIFEKTVQHVEQANPNLTKIH